MTPLDNLRKVEGLSFEDIIEAIEREGFKYVVEKGPSPTDLKYHSKGYFRDSQINLFLDDKIKLYVQLSSYWAHIIDRRTFSVRACYDILPDFDMKQINGPIYFMQGKLVERVMVRGVRRLR